MARGKQDFGLASNHLLDADLWVRGTAFSKDILATTEGEDFTWPVLARNGDDRFLT